MQEYSQSFEDAQCVETGGLKNHKGVAYTEKNYPFQYLLDAYHPSIPVYEWKTVDGVRHQEYVRDQVDLTRHESDDGEYIDSKLCRCCKSSINHYSERFFKKVFCCNSWDNFEFSERNGYCRDCAYTKATINYGKFDPSLSVINRYETCEENEYREIKEMEDGSIVEDMSPSERRQNRR